MSEHKEKWTTYLSERRATYEYRARTRYAGVYAALNIMGLADGDSILDVGAGDCQFGRYCLERGWKGLYHPVDAVINGSDLECWEANGKRSFIVSIEVVEHLIDPLRFIREMRRAAIKGMVITTPNCAVVDVLRCDPTHVSVVTEHQLKALGFDVTTASWFSEQHKPGQQDTLVATWKCHG